MKTLFLDVSTGVAGDMLSAALLELFDDREEIVERLNGIGIPGVVFRADKVKSYDIDCTHMTVTWKGIEEEPGCQHLHDAHVHHHDHRHLFDIHQIVDKLDLPFRVKTHVREVYYLIAEAEAKVHGEPMEHIHFHELGTMDAVADISAACLMIDLLQPDRIVATPICTGFGSIACAHGILPVPAPATAVILERVPSFAGEIEGELSTPTGTALIRHFTQDYAQQPPMVVEKRGCGVGKKDFGRLSAVRASIGEAVSFESLNSPEHPLRGILMAARRLQAWAACGILKKRSKGGCAMTSRDEKQLQQELLRCEDTIRWYRRILDNPGVSQSAKDAARDMLKQAERAKREILSKLQG